MTSNMTAGLDLFTTTFQNTTILHSQWLLGLILLAFTLILITRNHNQWGILGLPVAVGWQIVGVPQSLLIYILLTIIFTINVLSTQLLGALISTAASSIRETRNTFARGKDKKMKTPIETALSKQKGSRPQAVNQEIDPLGLHSGHRKKDRTAPTMLQDTIKLEKGTRKTFGFIPLNDKEEELRKKFKGALLKKKLKSLNK